jgi:hypothetical protein
VATAAPAKVRFGPALGDLWRQFPVGGGHRDLLTVRTRTKSVHPTPRLRGRCPHHRVWPCGSVALQRSPRRHCRRPTGVGGGCRHGVTPRLGLGNATGMLSPSSRPPHCVQRHHRPCAAPPRLRAAAAMRFAVGAALPPRAASCIVHRHHAIDFGILATGGS